MGILIMYWSWMAAKLAFDIPSKESVGMIASKIYGMLSNV